MRSMIHPFTRFDFMFRDQKVAADYEDIDGILHFTFRINDLIELSAEFSHSHLDYVIEINRLHYGEVMKDERPSSRFKGSGLAAACIEQVMRKHPELRFGLRADRANTPALEFATRLAQRQLYFFVL